LTASQQDGEQLRWMPAQKQEPGRHFACGVSRREVGVSAPQECDVGLAVHQLGR
jgi:hypothetical protein